MSYAAGFFVSFIFLMVAVSVHEFSHAWTAYKLGDNTAKYSGRLTLNPLAHIDPFGTVILPLFLMVATGGRFVFGAAKPVPIDYRALRNPKTDMIWIGASGPAANIIFAFFLSVLWRFLPASLITGLIFRELILINVILGVFNLLPIPPLDGSRILMGLLPAYLADWYSRLESFGFILVLLFIWIGAADYIIWPAVNFVLKVLTFPF